MHEMSVGGKNGLFQGRGKAEIKLESMFFPIDMYLFPF